MPLLPPDSRGARMGFALVGSNSSVECGGEDGCLALVVECLEARFLGERRPAAKAASLQGSYSGA